MRGVTITIPLWQPLLIAGNQDPLAFHQREAEATTLLQMHWPSLKLGPAPQGSGGGFQVKPFEWMEATPIFPCYWFWLRLNRIESQEEGRFKLAGTIFGGFTLNCVQKVTE